jgi:hypothetical protein
VVKVNREGTLGTYVMYIPLPLRYCTLTGPTLAGPTLTVTIDLSGPLRLITVSGAAPGLAPRLLLRFSFRA